MKRVTYSVRYLRSDGTWTVVRERTNVLAATNSKAEAVTAGAGFARQEWEVDGHPTELVIFNRDGRIGKGASSRRTYGRDPSRTKG